MLKALYDYAVREGLAVPPGYAPKIIKYYISLSSAGDFLGFVPGSAEAVLCPDAGSLIRGKDKSNILAEKSDIVLGEPSQLKSKFFRNSLSEGGSFEPDLLICLKALEDTETFSKICEEAKNRKIKPLDRISFEVNGGSVLKSEAVKTWWPGFLSRLKGTKTDNNKTLCLITGQPTAPVATVPTVTGLADVGGNSNGSSLICFDKNSFCSYNLKQSANAPVSEEAFSYVKAGLDNLLKDAPILSGMKFVHWYDKPVPEENDMLAIEISGFGIEVEKEEEDDSDEYDDSKNPYEERRLANKKIESISTGENSPALASVYTIMLLSGVNGRVMVRRYEHGSYEDLQKSLDLWNSDLSLVNRSGSGKVIPYTLNWRFQGLLTKTKQKSSKKKTDERMGKELSGLTAVTLTSIISGTPLPDSAAVRALAYIRSQMLETDDENKTLSIPNSRAVQWLKVWLMRKHRSENKEEFLMEEYNPKHPDATYHCGALMCVYANIQKMVMPEINASMISRYYSLASQNPALVIGTLSRQSTHHQEKITSTFWKNTYTKLLSDCYLAIGDKIPATLNLEQQSLFSLGYYQMQAELIRIINEYNAEKKKREAEKKAAETTGKTDNQ